MKPRNLVLATLLALPAASAACQGKDTTTRRGSKMAPALELTALDGTTFDLQDQRGKVVLLNMWATWCEPCREELPELARLHREHEEAGLTVVGVNVDVSKLEDRVRAMADDFQLPFPVLLDPGNSSVPKFEIVGYPTSFVIGRDGAIRWRRDGIILENDDELAGVVAAALAE